MKTLLLAFTIIALILLWELVQVRIENHDLRTQNERLIARIAQEYHFSAGRPGPPPTVPEPPAPSRRPFFSFHPKPSPIRRIPEE